MGKASTSQLTGLSAKASGPTTKSTARLPSPNQMAPPTPVSGKTTCIMAREPRSGLMGHGLEETISMGTSMGWGCLNWRMGATTRVSSSKTRFKAKEPSNGKMVECTMENGLKTR